MSYTSIIASVVVLLACIVPIIMINQRGKRKRQLMTNRLSQFAQERNSNLDEAEVWNESVIGVDKSKHKLFFIKNVAGEELHSHIDLNEVKKCQLVNVKKTLPGNDGGFMIEKLELQFDFHDKSKPGTSWEFYNMNKDQLTVNGELQVIEKWHKLVNDLMKSVPKPEPWHF